MKINLNFSNIIFSIFLGLGTTALGVSLLVLHYFIGSLLYVIGGSLALGIYVLLNILVIGGFVKFMDN